MRQKRHPERVMEDMLERGWNQAELARSARVSDDAVSRLVNDGPVSIAQIARIARALGQPVSRYVSVEAEEVVGPAQSA